MASFVINKQQFFVSFYLLLRCLRDTTDKHIFDAIIRGSNGSGSSFFRDRVEFMLHEGKKHGVYQQEQALALVGSRFRIMIEGAHDTLSDEEVGRKLLKDYVLVHLDNNDDKFEMLVFMLQKLLRFVNGACVADNSDALANQELLTVC